MPFFNNQTGKNLKVWSTLYFGRGANRCLPPEQHAAALAPITSTCAFRLGHPTSRASPQTTQRDCDCPVRLLTWHRSGNAPAKGTGRGSPGACAFRSKGTRELFMRRHGARSGGESKGHTTHAQQASFPREVETQSEKHTWAHLQRETFLEQLDQNVVKMEAKLF